VSLYIVKIVKDTESGDVTIYSGELSDNWYTELSNRELNIFKDNGWRYGVYVLTLSNLSLKHRRLSTMIELVKLGKKQGKHSIASLEKEIVLVEEKQKEITLKLNKIK